MPTPNAFAYAMLIAWPLVAAWLFSRFPVDRAAILTILLGYLLLPTSVGFDFPLLPPLDKKTIPPLAALVFCLAKGSGGPGLAKLNLASLVLAIVMVGSPLITALHNNYALNYGPLVVPAFTLLDGVKAAANHFIMLSSFYIGYRYVSGQTSQRSLLEILVGAGLLYSIPALLEVRLSPQFHTWVYGFFPHSFVQMRRGDGFRPLVFLEHGLHVALFFALCIIGALALRHVKKRVLKIPTGGAALYLGVVLVLCKSLGALIYAVIILPFVIAPRPRIWITIASGLAVLVCAYPIIRTQRVIPIDIVKDAASGVSTDRASSFEYRLVNEEKLLQKVDEKPIFGWGLQGRSVIYSEEDGSQLSVVDGAWIITMGTFGWAGFIALFGLISVSILRLRGAFSRLRKDEQFVAGGLALMLAANLVDMLPNAAITPVTWLIAGSLTGTGLARSSRRGMRPPARLADDNVEHSQPFEGQEQSASDYGKSVTPGSQHRE